VFPQVLLGREWEVRKIFERFQVGGPDACGIEFPAIRRHVVVGVPKRPLQPFELQVPEFVRCGGLDWFQ
jgi:hypothetical protein